MGGQTDDQDNDVGTATPEPGGEVVQFPRDWFGPREELVPLGPHAETEAVRPEAEAPDAEAPANGAGPASVALDFWGGVTTLDDLVPFPATAGADGETSAPVAPEGGRWPTRSLLIRRPSRRRVAVAVALLFCGVIALRALGAQSPGRTAAGRAQILARTDRALDSRDEPRPFGVRRLAIVHKPRPSDRVRHAVTHRHPTGARSSPPPSSGQPVAYSPPAGSQSSPTENQTPAASAASSSASGGGGSGSQRTVKPGPTGPGATFGPGSMKK